jgi:hypothetical protein
MKEYWEILEKELENKETELDAVKKDLLDMEEKAQFWAEEARKLGYQE